MHEQSYLAVVLLDTFIKTTLLKQEYILAGDERKLFVEYLHCRPSRDIDQDKTFQFIWCVTHLIGRLVNLLGEEVLAQLQKSLKVLLKNWRSRVTNDDDDGQTHSSHDYLEMISSIIAN